MSKYLKNIFLSYSIILAKEFYNSNQTINDEIVKHINDALVELKKDIKVMCQSQDYVIIVIHIYLYVELQQLLEKDQMLQQNN